MIIDKTVYMKDWRHLFSDLSKPIITLISWESRTVYYVKKKDKNNNNNLLA